MRRMFWATIFVLLLAGYLRADVPNEVTYTGYLKEYGQPVTGTRNVNFRIYSTQTGPGQVWESGAQNISVSSGTFSCILSPNFDLRGGDFWIETIVSGKTLVPREKITAQFYALHSASAESLSSASGKSINFIVGASTRASLSSEGEFKAVLDNTEYFMIPRRGIIMWSGAIDSIPTGWAVCDGSNSTPDLTDRFIVSAGNLYDIGTTGGDVNHSHSISANTSLGLNSSNQVSNTTSMPDKTAHADGNGGGGILTSCDHTHTYSHHHSVSTTSSVSSNIPPYYALFFIMKL